MVESRHCIPSRDARFDRQLDGSKLIGEVHQTRRALPVNRKVATGKIGQCSSPRTDRAIIAFAVTLPLSPVGCVDPFAPVHKCPRTVPLPACYVRRALLATRGPSTFKPMFQPADPFRSGSGKPRHPTSLSRELAGPVARARRSGQMAQVRGGPQRASSGRFLLAGCGDSSRIGRHLTVYTVAL